MSGKPCEIHLQILSLDRIVHDPTRLTLMSLLYVIESADFVFIQNQTALTGGNISSHMNKLEAAGYVKIKKDFVGKRPHTMFRLTKRGRSAFDRYRKTLSNALSGCCE